MSLGVLPSVALSIEDCICSSERFAHSSFALTGVIMFTNKINEKIITFLIIPAHLNNLVWHLLIHRIWLLRK